MEKQQHWWDLRIRIQAETPAKGFQALHGVLMAQQGVLSITQAGVKKALGPWRPIEDAPRKNGQRIIGYNDAIDYAETATWSDDVKAWLDLDMNPVPLTHWMPQYPAPERSALPDWLEG